MEISKKMNKNVEKRFDLTGIRTRDLSMNKNYKHIQNKFLISIKKNDFKFWN